MSPSEDELRSALSDGAGDVPDVDHIVFVAKERRVQRRKRALSVAGAVVLVGALGTGGTVLVRAGSAPESAAGGGDYARVPGGTRTDSRAGRVDSGNQTNGVDQSSGGSGAAAGGGAVSCPSHVPTTLLPGGGGTTRFGSTGRLFTQPVDIVTVCAYPAFAGSSATSVKLTGADATGFAASLENAPKTVSRGMCSDLRTQQQMSLAIFATTAGGTQLPTVTTTINEPACAVVVTNGTAVRHGWSWPVSLHDQLAELVPNDATGSAPVDSPSGVPSSVTAPGRIVGSPLH